MKTGRPAAVGSLPGVLRRRGVLAVAVALSVLGATGVSWAQPAQDETQGIERARMIFEGRILRNQVNVRSGPSENHYPVMRLDAETRVIVNGIKFDWLTIVPPEGAFSLVARDFVDVTGSTGRITGSNVNVRAGSLLNNQYSSVHGKLQRGDVVEVLGEVELDGRRWVRIKPPPGTVLFVHKDFVAPVRAIGPAPAEPTRRPAEPARPPVAGDTPGRASPPAGSPLVGGAYGGGVAGDPAALGQDSGTGIPGTERVDAPRAPAAAESAFADAIARAEAEYDAAERAWQAAMNLPLEEQPIPELLARYEALADNDDLPVTLRRQAAATAAFLRNRNATRTELLELRRSQEEMRARLRPLEEQNRQLMQQFQQIEATRFTAIGQLQPSALQQAGHPLHRLVDPASGATLVYLMGTGGMPLGAFIGVRGRIVRDETLGVNVITPEAAAVTDPSAFGRSVFAEIFPASLRNQLPATPPR